MKYLLIIPVIISTFIAEAQTFGSIKLSLQYSQTMRPGLQSYLEELADSMNISSNLHVNNGFGFEIGFIGRSGHFEIEAGGGYTISGDETGSETNNLLYYRINDLHYNFGLNYLPVNFFLIGADFLINSARGKSDVTGNGLGEQKMELLPAKDFHIFRGYSIGLRGQSGFYIPLNKDNESRLRLTAYYTMGLSKYNFYTVSEKRLSGFTGDQKTNYHGAGIELGWLHNF